MTATVNSEPPSRTLIRAGAMPAATPEVPVVIVGAGACGLTAALMLADAGIECVVVERDARPGGSTALSSGFIPGAGTRVQRAAGVGAERGGALDDSPERFAADIQAKARGTAAAHLVRAYTRAVPLAIDALEQRHGLQFELLDGFLYPGHSVRRMHALRERTGAALIAALAPAAEQAGVVTLTNALGTELWCTPGDQVLGIGVQRPGGAVEHIGCRALLLACNGFGGNTAMVAELLPEMRGAPFAGHTGNDGTAIAWGRSLGAALADLGGCQGHGSWAVPQEQLITWALMSEGGIQVNAHGERFHDETGGYSEAAVQVLAQPGGIAWNLFDRRLLTLGRTFADFREAEAAGAVREAGDAAALARLIGCNVQRLAATLEATRLVAPYFAIRVTGALFHTQGGLAIDEHCRVLRRDGAALPNLLAAGGAARGVSGNAVWGYLSGNGLLSAIGGGFVAAASVVGSMGGMSGMGMPSRPAGGFTAEA